MLTFTDRARDVVLSFMDQSGGELEALRIALVDGSPVAPRFELTLVSMDEQEEDERRVDADGLPVLIRESQAERLEGARVDYVERINEAGFEITPAAAPPSAQPSGAPSGDLADTVRRVLETQINPAIASHGGFITLVDVKDTEVFVEMGGGCQGCALSRMTLSQGVDRMLRQAIPEITAVHDVTDHASGVNPYFQH